MPRPDRPANRRRPYALLAIASAMLLLARFLQWPEGAWEQPLLRLLGPVAAGGLVGGLMLWWAPGLLDTYPRNRFWRILLEGVPPLLLYMLAIGRWPDVVAQSPAGWPRVAAALVPALLVLWAAVAFARYVRMLDELQQRLELQSLALAAAVVGVLGAAAGFLHLAGIATVPGSAGVWVVPLLGVAYAVIRTVMTRHYE